LIALQMSRSFTKPLLHLAVSADFVVWAVGEGVAGRTVGIFIENAYK